MAQQLRLLEVEKRPARRRGRAVASARVSAGQWQLDERTIAVGRRGLEEARRVLRASGSQAA